MLEELFRSYHRIITQFSGEANCDIDNVLMSIVSDIAVSFNCQELEAETEEAELVVEQAKFIAIGVLKASMLDYDFGEFNYDSVIEDCLIQRINKISSKDVRINGC